MPTASADSSSLLIWGHWILYTEADAVVLRLPFRVYSTGRDSAWSLLLDLNSLCLDQCAAIVQ